MDKQEVEQLVEKRITEAKLAVTETRLQTLTWIASGLLALFGVIIPLWLTNRSADKVDAAVADMQKQFKELAGVQLRKPSLECLLDGKSLEGSTLNFSESHRTHTIELRNSGDAPAGNIRIRLYTNFVEGVEIWDDQTQWQSLPYCDEPTYSRAFEVYQPGLSIDPQEARPIRITLPIEQIQKTNFPALLKIFYEQPQPRRYVFAINIGSADTTQH
jgi:hypothetical protein